MTANTEALLPIMCWVILNNILLLQLYFGLKVSKSGKYRSLENFRPDLFRCKIFSSK